MKKKYKNSGMTLIEMLMTIAIIVIGIGGFTLLFIRVWEANSFTIELGQSSMSVSEGLNKMVDYIRRARQGDDGSYPIKSVSNNDLVIFSDYNNDGVTERLHFYKNNQNILMGVSRPTAIVPKTYPIADEQILTLMTHIMNDSSESIFQYFNSGYPADQINNPLLEPFRILDIRLLKIYLEINIDPRKAPDNIKMQSFVEMRNLNDYNKT